MPNQPEAAPLPLSLELFEQEVGGRFTITFTDASFDLYLREAEALKYHDPQIHARHPFSLLFVCADQRVLNQGTYAIDHERLGRREIFIVPVGADENGVEYEAVFN